MDFKTGLLAVGYLDKRSKMNVFSWWRKYWFVLEGDKLYFFKTKQHFEKKRKADYILNLDKIQSVSEIGDKRKNHNKGYWFEILTAAEKIILSANEETARNHWVSTLADCLKRFKSGGELPRIEISSSEQSSLTNDSNGKTLEERVEKYVDSDSVEDLTSLDHDQLAKLGIKNAANQDQNRMNPHGKVVDNLIYMTTSEDLDTVLNNSNSPSLYDEIVTELTDFAREIEGHPKTAQKQNESADNYNTRL